MYPSTYNRQAVNQYANVHNETALEDASPHRLVFMLMEGLISRINSAKGAIGRSDLEKKSLYISKAIAIVGGLDEGLDLKQGGEIAENLKQLYGYMRTRLLMASNENSIEKLDEVASLMKEVKDAWAAIAP